jgi:hypothetical protein
VRPKWRDLQFSQPASDSDGSSALTFVIPPVPARRGTEVEGSAVLSTSIRFEGMVLRCGNNSVCLSIHGVPLALHPVAIIGSDAWPSYPLESDALWNVARAR